MLPTILSVEAPLSILTCYIFSLVVYFPILHIITYCSIQAFCTTKDIPCRQFLLLPKLLWQTKLLTAKHTKNIVTITITRSFPVLRIFYLHFPYIIIPAVYAMMATRHLLLVLLMYQLLFVHIELQPLF